MTPCKRAQYIELKAYHNWRHRSCFCNRCHHSACRRARLPTGYRLLSFAFIRCRHVRFVFWLLTRPPKSNTSADLSTAILTSRRSLLTRSPELRRGCAITPLSKLTAALLFIRASRGSLEILAERCCTDGQPALCKAIGGGLRR